MTKHDSQSFLLQYCISTRLSSVERARKNNFVKAYIYISKMGCSASTQTVNSANAPGAVNSRPVNVAPVREMTMVCILI